MGKTKTYPHYATDVRDMSSTTVYTEEALQLHIPMFLGFAEKGITNVPVLGGTAIQMDNFGSGTFHRLGKFFKHPNLFFERALQAGQALYVRVADATAKTASLVLYCSVYESEIPTYSKDSDNRRIVDEDGEYAVVDGVTIPGVTIKWTLEEHVGDTLTGLVPQTSEVPDPDGGVEVSLTKYPIMAAVVSSPGAWGNGFGFSMYWSSDTDQTIPTNIDALAFTLKLMETTYNSDTPANFRTIYSNNSTEFSFREETTDPETYRRYSLDEVIDTDYSSVPFSYHLYTNNIEIIGSKVLAKESVAEFPELTNAWMVNLLTGKDLESRHYNALRIDESEGTVVFSPNYINYFKGGNDGATTSEALDELVETYFTDDVYPPLQDSARYPFTHMYDSGYHIDTKFAMMNYMGVRDDFKVAVSPQMMENPPNTEAEDLSAASILKTKALLHPDSLVYGTANSRVTIMGACGALNEVTTFNSKSIPTTYHLLDSKCRFHNSITIKDVPKTLPNAQLTVLKDISWTPVASDFKQISWDACLNYCQYYNQTDLHYPDIVTVYNAKTSLLSSDVFSDYIIYIKHMARKVWATWVGSEADFDILSDNINRDLTTRISDAMGNFINFEIDVYQTDEDTALGYALSINVSVYGNTPSRIHNVRIDVYRNETES